MEDIGRSEQSSKFVFVIHWLVVSLLSSNESKQWLNYSKVGGGTIHFPLPFFPLFTLALPALSLPSPSFFLPSLPLPPLRSTPL